jgi:hypothetical protein
MKQIKTAIIVALYEVSRKFPKDKKYICFLSRTSIIKFNLKHLKYRDQRRAVNYNWPSSQLNIVWRPASMAPMIIF